MKIEITDYASWKFPNKNLKNICWIWYSEKHSSIFFSLERKIAIYNQLQKKWKSISLDEYECDTECAEALTTTDNYLVFAGFPGDFEVYDLPELKHVKSIEIENSGYGAASFKNFIFINSHDPFGIQMLELPSGKIIRAFSAEEVLGSDEYILNSIGCNEKYVTGLFENTSILGENEKISHYYVTWNFHDGTSISKIPSEQDNLEDPIISKDNLLIADNKIYNLITSEKLNELNLSNNEYILTGFDNYIFTILNEETEKNRIRVYSKQENGLFQDFEFNADEVHTFKNIGDYILILKENYFHLIPITNFIKSIDIKMY